MVRARVRARDVAGNGRERPATKKIGANRANCGVIALRAALSQSDATAGHVS